MKERQFASTSSFNSFGRWLVFAFSCAVGVEFVTLDHTLQRRAVNTEDARGGLLVAARAREDARDVLPLKFRERQQRPVILRGRVGGRQRRGLRSRVGGGRSV